VRTAFFIAPRYNAGMKHRKLQIAWSVAWGVPTVLLVALWVRSYWHADRVDIASHLELISFYGEGHYKFIHSPYLLEHDWYFSSASARAVFNGTPSLKAKKTQIFFSSLGFGHASSLPLWSIIGVFAAIAATSWMRFSPRALLIATTLFAAGLALIVWAKK
jgi:hypothetical protein